MTPLRVRFLVNWGLILGALGSVSVVVATQSVWTSAERAARASHLVVGFREAEIDRIRISTSGQVLELVRAEDDGAGSVPHPEAHEHDARWVFVEPYQGEAEEATVDALLHALQYAPFVRKVPEEAFDRRAAGLDPPKQTIELFTDSVRTRVHLGGAALAPANAHYVEIGGEGTANKGIYVVSDATADALLVNLDEFRVRQIVPYGASGLKTVTLTDAKGRSVVLRAGDAGDWRLDVEQRGVRVEEAAVRRLFAALSRSRVERFVSENAPEGALSDEQIQVTLEPKAEDKPTLSLRFGGGCPVEPTLRLALRVSEPPLAGCTVPLHLDTFLDQLPEMVERRLFGFPADMVERVTLRAGERALEIARRDEAWAMFEPRSGVVERDVGEAFVESILAVRGELTTKPSSELAPFAQITITKPHLDGEATPEVVELYLSPQATAAQPGIPASGLLARRMADDAWLELPTRDQRLFQPNALLLRSTQLVNVEATQVSRVRIQTGEWTQAFDYRGHDVGCTLTQPAGYTADSALCLDHIDELRLLRARSWVAESDDGTFGLATPTLRATFSVEPPKDQSTGAANELTLTVGHRTTDGGYHAQLSSDPAVFTLRQGVVDVLTGLVVDRAPFILDAAEIQSLVITRGTGTSRTSFTLRRLGGDLVQVGQDGVGAPTRVLDEGAQVELLDALSLLRPEAAVTLLDSGRVSSAPRTYGFDVPLLEVRVRTRTEAGDRDFHWVVGRADVHRNVSVHYALPVTSGRSAVFALPRQGVQRILDAL